MTGTSVSSASARAGSASRVTIMNGSPARFRYGSHISTWYDASSGREV